MRQGGTICLWCAAPVTPRRGGSPKKFCSTRCRHEFHSCARRWAEAAVAAGALSVDVLKNADTAACTLLSRASYPAPVVSEVPSPYPTPVALRAENRHTRQQNLEQAMARAIGMRRRG